MLVGRVHPQPAGQLLVVVPPLLDAIKPGSSSSPLCVLQSRQWSCGGAGVPEGSCRLLASLARPCQSQGHQHLTAQGRAGKSEEHVPGSREPTTTPLREGNQRTRRVAPSPLGPQESPHLGMGHRAWGPAEGSYLQPNPEGIGPRLPNAEAIPCSFLVQPFRSRRRSGRGQGCPCTLMLLVRAVTSAECFSVWHTVTIQTQSQECAPQACGRQGLLTTTIPEGACWKTTGPVMALPSPVSCRPVSHSR